MSDEVTTSSAPRGASVAALTLSVAVHGVLLGAFGNEILRTTADPSTTGKKIINLTLTQTRPDSAARTDAVEPRESQSVGRTANSPVDRARTPEAVADIAPEKTGQSDPRPRLARPAPADTLTAPKAPPATAPPATAPNTTAEIVRPIVSDAMPQRSTIRGSVRITPVYAPPPPYPALAERRGLEGRVLLGVTVTYDGIPKEVGIITGSGHSILDRAALGAVRDWRFRVTGMDANKASEVVEVPIRFALQ